MRKISTYATKESPPKKANPSAGSGAIAVPTMGWRLQRTSPGLSGTSGSSQSSAAASAGATWGSAAEELPVVGAAAEEVGAAAEEVGAAAAEETGAAGEAAEEAGSRCCNLRAVSSSFSAAVWVCHGGGGADGDIDESGAAATCSSKAQKKKKSRKCIFE
mmetsp:Transcript_22272/g.56252  ORF Transcript_22272/g.56252 Transcript_22272/m.56252 type:complete len:160 (+) Transcript_22272:1972-2451(+)